MLLTVSGLVRTSVVSPFLPATPLLAGPWGAFASGGIEDSGFISYNHAYAGMQLILSGGAAYMFFEQFKRIRMLICSLLLLCTFASRSRACFILALLLVFVLEWKRTKSNLFVLVLLCCFGGLWAVRSSLTEDIVERQASSSSSLDEDGLSGRTDIWQEHLNYFAEHPLNVLFGTGYGYAGRVGSNNAHDMYLHVMTETGLAGLLLFLYLQRQTLLLLQSPHMRAMRLTFWALLITGLTQETLYPVAAFSHFLGFYLSALVIALRFGGNLKVAFVPLTRSSVANMICEAEI
jgi:O-antigen ligase